MALSTKQGFLAGIGAALAVFFVVGFFVLLFMVLRKEDTAIPQAANPAAVAGGTAPEAPLEISVAPVTDADWVRGNPDAGITLVEFSDLECPFCQSFHPSLVRMIDEYPDDVRWVYRHFPLSSIHPKAPKEAEAAECAGELGGNDGFWAFVDRLFEITPANNGFNLDELPDVAEYVGLNRADFSTCLDSGKYASKVSDQADQAVAASAQGTPYSVIVTPDGEKIPVNGAVPYSQLKSILDSLVSS
ncbi:MAG: thioredoxin domain-containing protein [Candidatus Sungbacteria bacterium]|uniref:Thioredoxin domain-containing protein n=1 Tax=Candidatus Sungiibacteriota bacterium TaxID=2750080 RepID=A0A932YXL0_9BACT|nr:thioredoxin domain-containing protein [Parcubacteria group bacterium]MBI4132945.1 thioredoxin domain-containing protein [Candidatus Sungbacteria bacterium]